MKTSKYRTFKLAAYCQCGKSMVGSGVADMAAVDGWWTVWWSEHSGAGHGPVDPPTEEE